MNNFLEKAAGYLFEQFGDSTGDICVVLPNRRAGLFLKKYMSQLTDRPIFAPTIYSIEDFVYSQTGLRKSEPAFLLFELYETYRQIEGSKAGPFREFLKWADVVLHDFNEVDLSLANPEALFSYLSESKAISLWNLDDQPLTDFEIRYLEFFNSLAELYTAFRSKLLNKKLAYQGLAYRVYVEQLNEDDLVTEWKHVFFMGFNALTPAEVSIVTSYKDKGVATLLWDTDPYYLDNPIQEAGSFLRQNKKTLGLSEFTWKEDHFKNGPKTINLIGVPKNVGQAKVAGDLLNKIRVESPNLDKTSIVLNDESLLSPLLNSLPEKVKAFNLTMGLPLQNTVLFGLIKSYILLNENALKFDKSNGKRLKYYYKDLLRMMDHPYFIRLNHQVNNGLHSPALQIYSSNQVFYTKEELVELFKDLSLEKQEDMSHLFLPWGNSAQNAINGILYLLKKLKFSFSGESENSNEIDLEYIFHFSKLFNKLKNSFDTYTFLNDLESLHRIFSQMVRTLSIPFYGEPLKGVQIMGMLETRTLDFEHVIMLSVNDDFIPGGSIANSFIPYELRRTFNLPTHTERNAVSAYHYYRLLQRASNVYLLFNTEPGDLGGGDKSRFITQIENELVKYNPQITIHQSILSVVPGNENTNDAIVINKSPDILDRLEKISGRGFSASAVNTYRNCSLQFYFKYVLGVDETREVEETIEASTLGTVVHEVLFQLYEKYKNQVLIEADFGKMLTEVEMSIQTAFRKHYSKGDIKHGKNLLITKVAESFVTRFLQMEKAWVKELAKFKEDLVIKDLEVKLEALYSVKNMPKNQFNLKGFVDRVDSRGGVVRIIDYKTGKVENSELKIKEWASLKQPGKYDKVFQLLYYANLYLLQNNTVSPKLEVGIFSFKNLKQGLLLPEFPGGVPIIEAMTDFRMILDDLFQEMFDEGVTFQQTEELNVCKYCIFKSICNR